MTIENYALVGPVTVRALIVHGPGAHRIPGPRVATIRAQLDACYRTLENLEPRARLVFRDALQQVNVAPVSAARDDDTDASEAGWLPQALGVLGFDDHESFLRHEMRVDATDQGVLILISALPKPHFAYATEDKITVDPSCGGYGLALMNAIVTHELCHVFGAADERPECNCDRLHGHLRVEHGNCYVCRRDPVPCIMAGNAFDLCPWTRRQIGWDKRLFPRP